MCIPLILLCVNELSAQEARSHRLRPLDVAIAAGALAVYATPHVFSINEHPPGCAPCDARRVPWVDRWAVVEPRDGADVASTALVALMTLAATADLAGRQPAHYGEIAYVAEAAGWAFGATALLKAAVARKRPVLYAADTAEANAAAGDLESQRSWPSGHAAVAAALAAGYLLVPRAHPVPSWRRWAAIGGAAAVGVLRVAAGRHFPTDVVGGAALGVVSAVTVRAFRF